MKRDTPQHQKMFALSSELKIPIYAAVGLMEMLWHFAAKASPRGDIGSIPDREIANGVGWSKRAAVLIDALCKTRWLDRDEDHRLTVHDWPDHCENDVLRRLQRSRKDFLPKYGQSVREVQSIQGEFSAKRGDSGSDTVLREGGCDLAPRVGALETETETELASVVVSEGGAGETPDGSDRVGFAESAQRMWNGTRGLKKLTVGERKLVQERWPRVEITENELRSALDRFAEWLKGAENVHSPLKLFLKDPNSWTTLRTEPKPATNRERAESSPGVVEAFIAAVLTAPERDYIAEWNAGVPAAPFTTGPLNGHSAGLRECAGNSVFAEKFADICEIAQKIHELRGAEVGWLTFTWVLKRGEDGKEPGWWRLLHDMRWMSVQKQSKKSKHDETMEEVMKLYEATDAR